MTKVVIDMTISLDGFVSGPDDSKSYPLGRHGGIRIFDWHTSGSQAPDDLSILHPEPGVNREIVDEMLAESGAFIFGRRTYEFANGWGGRHPANGAPVFILTHHPPSEYPRGPSNLTFVTDGIESAIRKAEVVANGKHIKLGGASPCKQALAAGLCDEIIVHVAPYLLGGGVRLFDVLSEGTCLEKLSVRDGPHATHLRYRVARKDPLDE